MKAFSKDIELETRTLLKAELASSYYLLCVVWCGLSPQARAPEYGSLVAHHRLRTEALSGLDVRLGVWSSSHTVLAEQSCWPLGKHCTAAPMA